VLDGPLWTGGSSIRGRAFLRREQPGYFEVHNLEGALRAAPALAEELDLLTDPPVIVALDEAPPSPEPVEDELMDPERFARIESIVVAALRSRSFDGEDEDPIHVSLDAGAVEVDGPRQVSFVVYVPIPCEEWDYESGVMTADEGLDQLLALAHANLAAVGEDCGLRVRDKE